jgi:hypothetical protein
MTEPDDERKIVAEKAARKLEERVGSFVSDSPAIKQEALIDKNRFIELLRENFDRLDKNGSNGISRLEILDALGNLGDYTADESITLLLALRYFDFISNLVDDDEGDEKVISRADVDTLSAFLTQSDMTLEKLCQWLGSADGEADEDDPDTGADSMRAPSED